MLQYQTKQIKLDNVIILSKLNLMKAYFFCVTLLILFTVQYSFGQTCAPKITITDIKPTKGKIYLAWYKTSQSFMDESKISYSKIVDLAGKPSQLVALTSIPKGDYAIAVFIDENGNGKLDTNFLGIPKEYYGFSNNVKHLTRAPSFEETKFSLLDPNQTLKISVK